MTKHDSGRTQQVGQIVAVFIGLATLLFVDITTLHLLIGALLLIHWSRNFSRPSSTRDRVIVSMALSLSLLLILSPIVNLALNYFGKARSWDIVLSVLWAVFGISFFIVKWRLELRRSRGEI